MNWLKRIFSRFAPSRPESTEHPGGQMDLKSFVETTLNDIIKAVAESRTALADYAYIAPYNQSGRNDLAPETKVMPVADGANGFVQDIDFDIAVTTSSASAVCGKTGVGIIVAGASVSAKAESTAAVQHISRIRFSVPVVFRSDLPYESSSGC